MKRQRRRAGYSLMEVVVVLSIIGTSAAVAVPRWANASARRRLEAAVRRVETDVRDAQRLARATGQSGVIVFDEDASRYEVQFSEAAQSLSRRDADEVNLLEDPYRVRIAKVDLPSDSIHIDGWGTITAGGTVVVAVGGDEREISFR